MDWEAERSLENVLLPSFPWGGRQHATGAEYLSQGRSQTEWSPFTYSKGAGKTPRMPSALTPK